MKRGRRIFKKSEWLSSVQYVTSHLSLSLSAIVGGKFPRPFELNTDIVTWTRLLTRADRGVGDVGSPALSHDKDERVKGKTAGSDSSPPLSPLTPSGESTPKSPLTPPQGVTAGMVQGTCLSPSVSLHLRIVMFSKWQ